MADYVSRDDVKNALLNKGQHTTRYRLGETWELNFMEILEALDAIPAADVQPIDRWISVKDRLPDEKEVSVLIWIKSGKADSIEIFDSCHIGNWVKEEKKFYDSNWDEITGVTHWQPTPDPPVNP